MKSEELTKEIEQYEQKMSALMSQMDNLYREIQDAMPTAAASWMSKEVERRIKDNPDAAQSLGIEKLRELKSKLKALTEKLPEIVAAEFQDRGRWPHHIEWKEIGSSNRQGEGSHLNSVFRNVISNLGGLLDEFGLTKETKAGIPSWERTGQKQFRYAINPGTDNLPESKMRDYGKLFSEYTTLSTKINSCRRSLSEAKAKELWDEA
jgi:uncharacterized coiled-coil protein SlyX